MDERYHKKKKNQKRHSFKVGHELSAECKSDENQMQLPVAASQFTGLRSGDFTAVPTQRLQLG